MRRDDECALPADPFGRTALPAAFSREDRVALIGAAAESLLHGELPAAPARLFMAGALLAWLTRGGSLESDYLRVTAPAGSHRTPAALWASSRGATDSDDDSKLPTFT